jgi:Leucine-rich repeat (LRR) protein
LYLSGNRVEDHAPLLGLRRLASLYLDDNRLRRIDGLGKLRTLSTLSLSGNRIEDLAPLAGLDTLQHLFLERNRIQDLSPVVRWVKSDTAQRFAPFLNLYLEGNPLGTTARRTQLGELGAAGVRVHRP